MSFKNIGYCLLSIGIVLITGCKKLVEVDPPKNLLVTTNVFNNDNAVIATQLAIYAQMQDIPWSLAVETGLSSDELTNFSTGQGSIDLYKNALDATIDGSNLPWAKIYQLIYQENAILENVQASSGLSKVVRKQSIGEAQFMRAFFYFYLVNLYGDVPLITTTDYKVNSSMSRTPKSKVYEQMILDLKSAQNELSGSYLDETDSVVTSDRVRPTIWAASALLARTYLYNEKFDSAEAMASIVIGNTSLFGLPGLDSVFLANSQEAIWQIIPPSSQQFTYEGDIFTLFAPPGGSGMNNSNAISPQLLSAFDSNDNRKTKWIGNYVDGTDTFYFPYKYKNNSVDNQNPTEYSMVMRLAEQYLIRAEARVQQNNLTGAINDINVIRVRAGLASLPFILNKDQALSAIAHERQTELFTEAQRWLDIKRTSTADAIMNFVATKKGGSWNTDKQLYPLPALEIQGGVNLSQNKGY